VKPGARSEPSHSIQQGAPGLVPPRIAVIGGGITGLAAAYEIAKCRPDAQLHLIEPKGRLGGNIETITREGYLLDGGPDSFLRTKPEGTKLCEELGLGHELMAPVSTGSKFYIGNRGKLVPMPAGMALAVPTRLGPLLETKLISFFGKLRILGDLFIEKNARGSGVEDETVAAFLERHFGREVTDHLAGPLLGGIFAGDIEELSIKSTFPQLVDLEKREGSLIRALFTAERARAKKALGETLRSSDDPYDPIELFALVRWLRRENPVSGHLSPFQSLKSGMGGLIAALTGRLSNAQIKLERSVVSLSHTQNQWTVVLDGNEAHRYDGVLLCVPSHVAARIVSTLPAARLSHTLNEIPYVSTATVFFALDREPKQQKLDASGFIVPRVEGRLLASTWVSSKWAGRAPEGGALLRVFLGGAREPNLVENSSDSELEQIGKDELERYMGRLDDVTRFTQVFRWVRSNPQPIKGHAARLAAIDAEVAHLPGLALASSAYDGVGIPDCIRQGRAAAGRVLASLG